MNLINARATEQYNEWKANATEEQKADQLAKLQRYKTDEAFRNERKARMEKAWSEADANGDGKLD